MRDCGTCNETKDLESFYRYPNGRRYSVCKVCHNTRTRVWQEANPHKKRESGWRTRGIEMTVAEYEALYASQTGLCKVCRRAEPVSGRLLAVDHDHRTGKVRGLLCTKCNTTAGWFEQYPYLFEYLRGDSGNAPNAN